MSNDVISKPKNSNIESISLSSWVDSFHNEEEMREIFLNMDRAMKYIHDKGYCIGSFDPRKIDILNNSVNQIRFDDLLPMPVDLSERRKIIKDDIYNSSFIQIGLYSNCLNYLRRDFLKSNFDSFAQFLPVGDVPYYRGVIDRGASVYFCEYAMEKVNRDLIALENELAGQGVGKELVKGGNRNKYNDVGINDRINDNIYKQISGKKDAAFISFLVFPTIMLVLGAVFALIAWFISVL